MHSHRVLPPNPLHAVTSLVSGNLFQLSPSLPPMMITALLTEPTELPTKTEAAHREHRSWPWPIAAGGVTPRELSKPSDDDGDDTGENEHKHCVRMENCEEMSGNEGKLSALSGCVVELRETADSWIKLFLRKEMPSDDDGDTEN